MQMTENVCCRWKRYCWIFNIPHFIYVEIDRSKFLENLTKKSSFDTYWIYEDVLAPDSVIAERSFALSNKLYPNIALQLSRRQLKDYKNMQPCRTLVRVSGHNKAWRAKQLDLFLTSDKPKSSRKGKYNEHASFLCLLPRVSVCKGRHIHSFYARFMSEITPDSYMHLVMKSTLTVNIYLSVRFGVLTSLTVNITIFWDGTSYRVKECYQRIWGTRCLEE
jgi:hypothetical protein